MTRFRPQRGGFDQSMAEAVDVTTWEELRQHVWQTATAKLVAVEPYGLTEGGKPIHDPREKWGDTYVVIADYGHGLRSPVGFTDGPVEAPAGAQGALEVTKDGALEPLKAPVEHVQTTRQVIPAKPPKVKAGTILVICSCGWVYRYANNSGIMSPSWYENLADQAWAAHLKESLT